MVMINAIIVGVCSLLLIISPLLKLRPKILYNIRLLSCVFTVGCGVHIIEEILGISWLKSLVITIVYLMAVIIITNVIESIFKKNTKRDSQNSRA